MKELPEELRRKMRPFRATDEEWGDLGEVADSMGINSRSATIRKLVSDKLKRVRKARAK